MHQAQLTLSARSDYFKHFLSESITEIILADTKLVKVDI